ncbi:hypothetical protein BKA62DRAFT_680613 [Auriculariales sp. MPI-PUGE-AT-0066]|nr:hypothetical protein BKA62DRAFT_680613 [Auriculariales sp. MPI-PUGE-AT-0066]
MDPTLKSHATPLASLLQEPATALSRRLVQSISNPAPASMQDREPRLSTSFDGPRAGHLPPPQISPFLRHSNPEMPRLQATELVHTSIAEEPDMGPTHAHPSNAALPADEISERQVLTQQATIVGTNMMQKRGFELDISQALAKAEVTGVTLEVSTSINVKQQPLLSIERKQTSRKTTFDVSVPTSSTVRPQTARKSTIHDRFAQMDPTTLQQRPSQNMGNSKRQTMRKTAATPFTLGSDTSNQKPSTTHETQLHKQTAGKGAIFSLGKTTHDVDLDFLANEVSAGVVGEAASVVDAEVASVEAEKRTSKTSRGSTASRQSSSISSVATFGPRQPHSLPKTLDEVLQHLNQRRLQNPVPMRNATPIKKPQHPAEKLKSRRRMEVQEEGPLDLIEFDIIRHESRKPRIRRGLEGAGNHELSDGETETIVGANRREWNWVWEEAAHLASQRSAP